MEFVEDLSVDGRAYSGRSPTSHENWRKAVHVPTKRQPNRGLTDDDPEFTCSVCRLVFPMAEAHRMKTKDGSRRTGRCVPCALAKQREANDRQATKRRGADYVPPGIKDRLSPVVDGERRCLVCNEVKSLAEFYVEPSVSSGYQSQCIKCALIRKRAAHLLRTYNLTETQYLEMLARQDGLCAICRQPETAKRKTEGPVLLSVDHDHACCPGSKSCGVCVRQLLCHMCNFTIGLIERVGSVDPFAAYLARHAAG